MQEDEMVRELAKQGYGPDAIADTVGIPVEEVLEILNEK